MGQRSSFVVELPVRPRHCDAQGMLHAARYYEYFEEAFLQWLEVSASSYAELRGRGTDPVIVESRCTHHRPVALDAMLAITVVPVDVGRRSLIVEFVVAAASTHVATGRTTYVAVVNGTAARLPQDLASLAPTQLTQPLTRRAAERLLSRLHTAQRASYAGEASIGSDPTRSGGSDPSRCGTPLRHPPGRGTGGRSAWRSIA